MRFAATYLSILLTPLAGCVLSGAPEFPLAPQDVERLGHPRITLQGSYSSAEVEHGLTHSSIKDTVQVDFRRLQGNFFRGGPGTVIGMGFNLEDYHSENTLFGYLGERGEAESLDLMTYIFHRGGDGELWRVHTRLGYWYNRLKHDYPVSQGGVHWTTNGVQLSVEPEFVVLYAEAYVLSFFAEVSGSAGSTDIDVIRSGSFGADATRLSFEVGPRLRIGDFLASLSYFHRSLNISDGVSDSGSLAGVDDSIEGLAFSMGVRF